MIARKVYCDQCGSVVGESRFLLLFQAYVQEVPTLEPDEDPETLVYFHCPNCEHYLRYEVCPPNTENQMRVTIGDLVIGHGFPTAFIAELSNAHNGDFSRAIRLLDAAKESGASLAKLQAYTPDELIELRGDGTAPPPWDGWTMRDLYTKAMTPREWFPDLFAHAEKIGLPLFSSVFGLESLEVLESLGCQAYKISSFERDQEPLRLAIEATGKPVIISRPDHPDPEIPTLYCPPGYPQSSIDYEAMKGFFGFSYHGTKISPVISAAKLVPMIEFHFHLSNEPSELESNVSLDEIQLRAITGTIQTREAA